MKRICLCLVAGMLCVAGCGDPVDNPVAQNDNGATAPKPAATNSDTTSHSSSTVATTPTATPSSGDTSSGDTATGDQPPSDETADNSTPGAEPEQPADPADSGLSKLLQSMFGHPTYAKREHKPSPSQTAGDQPGQPNEPTKPGPGGRKGPGRKVAGQPKPGQQHPGGRPPRGQAPGPGPRFVGPNSGGQPPSDEPVIPKDIGPKVGKSSPTVGAPSEKAAPGAGEKGRGYGGGIVTEPIHAYFAAKETIVFTIQIPHAMDLYYATNDRWPKSAEEFQKEIIVANNIELPELPAGDRYVYEVKTHELMVEHPKR